MFEVTQVGSWPRSRPLLRALRDRREGRISLWICLTDNPADVAIRTSDRSGRASNVACAWAP